MGLKMTLPRECNNLQYEFKDAYWSITEIAYDTEFCYFVLACYPSREHKLIHGESMPEPVLPIGGVISNIIQTELYRWKGTFAITDIFPEYIPLDSNKQKTTIYNFIKAFTARLYINFEDVFEDDNSKEA